MCFLANIRVTLLLHKTTFHQDFDPVVCRGGVFRMVKTFLRKTIGSVPFVGQCFLLSDYLEWARNSGTSEVLYSIINLFEKKKLLVPDFVPRGFEARRGGVSRGGNTNRTSQCFIISCCPSRSHLARCGFEGRRRRRNPTLPCLETPPAVTQNPSCHAAKHHLRRAFGTPGDKIWDQNFQV